MALYKDVSDGSSLDDARLRWRRSIVVCRILEGDPTPKLELHDWFPQLFLGPMEKGRRLALQ
jgi:hypothetical protein